MKLRTDSKQTSPWFIALLASFLFVASFLQAQSSATIKESKTSLLTYPFSDPDPLPILTRNAKIYPYHRFDGYSLSGEKQDWTTVKLSNEYVEVYVLPEVGGKVWGAVEKDSGQEFIYRNEVMKFRNIAMRGPWTSGGIEFNFGIIGHHPGTATPVDYILQEEADGSVSCVVGNIDLPSRTQWRVKIRLPKDKAYFETQATWYNPTPLQQAYYNWMTAAAAAQPDLEFFTPGNKYLEHGGNPQQWPIDEQGRFLPAYENNNFGPSKSYHVVGKEHDFFGGYFHKQNFGFGHWAENEEMPGQKLWLWALSRSGGIWEDLLTDTDGQYIEFQAGRLFVQYSPGADQNPITQANFPPHTTDQWTEKWFPVKQIGGLSDVSEQAVLHVKADQEGVTIGINALSKVKGQMQIQTFENKVMEVDVDLEPMEVFQQHFAIDWVDLKSISVPEMDLQLEHDPDALNLNRPFHSPTRSAAPIASAERHYRSGLEAMKFREFTKATNHFESCLQLEPQHLDALTQMAELYYRRGQYKKALKYANSALQWDTYHPGANYLAGIIYRAQGDQLNAKESLGWAARSMTYRSAGYGEMAASYLQEGNLQKAKQYARKSLDFNRYNINAWESMAICSRLLKQNADAQQATEAILDIDPLNHFAYYEQYLMDSSVKRKANFMDRHRSEFPEQTFLELALSYYRKGQVQTAKELLQLAPQQALIKLWVAFLDQDSKALAAIGTSDPNFIFPYRRESLDALEWALQYSDHWTIKYYLALNYWAKDRMEEAISLLKSCGQTPDYAPFYLSRAHLLESVLHENPENDLLKALNLSKSDWRVQRIVGQHLTATGRHKAALDHLEKAYSRHKDNYAIGMDYVRQLVHAGQYETAIAILGKLEVLPFEGASEGRQLHEQAHIGAALKAMDASQWQTAIKSLQVAKEWPERLGVGKPYTPEERLSDFLLALCHSQLGNKEESTALHQKVWQRTKGTAGRLSNYHVLGMLSYQVLDLGQKETVAPLSLQALKQHDHPDVQWIMANYDRQLQDLKVLQHRFPDRWKSVNMQLLQRAIDLARR